jgi:hypothetical protein
MSKTVGFVGALVLGITSTLGCSSSSSGGGVSGGSPADFTALRASYSAPTGSLQSSDVLSVGKELSKQESQSSNVPTSTSNAPIHAQAIRHAGARPENTPVTCSAATASGVSCSCGGSGTFDETFNSSAAQSGVEEGVITYNDCVFDDSSGTTTETESISGSMSYADYTTAPAMFIYSGTLTETISPPGTTTTVNFDYALINGELTYSLSVADGTVLVSDEGSWDEATQSGTFTVTDKSGTWSCNITNGAGTCTGPGGTLNV